jgi:hypothetical protein
LIGQWLAKSSRRDAGRRWGWERARALAVRESDRHATPLHLFFSLSTNTKHLIHFHSQPAKMRFGRTLEKSIYEPWRDNYINYAKLKKLLREDDSASNSPNRQTSDRWTEDDEGAFVDELVNVQLEQVHAFHKDTYEKLGDHTAKCEARLDSVALADKGKDGEADKDSAGSNGKKAVPSEKEKKTTLEEVLKELDQITKETNELETYASTTLVS